MFRCGMRIAGKASRPAAGAFLAAAILAAADGFSQGPDLIINDAALNPGVAIENFPSADCAVVEGCAQPGSRRLLRFTTETRNIGDADLVLGSPVDNPLFEFSDCHRHYHFSEFADYRLLDLDGVEATGHKAGFCLLDSFRFDPNARRQRKYTCENQGIQAGWADVYGSHLDCQWIDITDVLPGTYVLEVEVNPAGILAESDLSNNVAAIEVVIPELTSPANDDCADAIQVSDGTTLFDNFSATTDGPSEPADCTFFNDPQIAADVWFLYAASCTGTVTVSLCGSSFDTELAVYPGSACPSQSGEVLACNDDSCDLQSVVKFTAAAGEPYLIRIGGFGGAQGEGSLSIGCKPSRGRRPR